MVRIAVCAAALVLASPAWAAGLPIRGGRRARTIGKRVETRLSDGSTHRPIAGSASAIAFANGGHPVSYDTVAAVEACRRGDAARIRLVSIAQGCPPGDARGRQSKTIDLRAGGSWTLPDAEHSCGGA